MIPIDPDNCNHQRRNLPGVHFVRRTFSLFPACARAYISRAFVPHKTRLMICFLLVFHLLQSNAWLLTDIYLHIFFVQIFHLAQHTNLAETRNHNNEKIVCVYNNLSYETANWTEKTKNIRRMANAFIPSIEWQCHSFGCGCVVCQRCQRMGT